MRYFLSYRIIASTFVYTSTLQRARHSGSIIQTFNQLPKEKKMNARKLLVSVLILVSVLFSACATAARQVAPTAVPLTNADSIAGTWSGTAKGGDFNFQITTTIAKSCAIGSVCGPFDIPAIPCSGEWTLMGISGTTYQMQAGSLEGKCAGNEGGSSDSLQLLADGTVLYKCTGGCGEEQGILQKVIAQATNPQLVEYKIPTSASEPGGIVAGPDGALWFVETAVNKIGRISTNGVVTEYSVSTAGAIETNHGFITVGPDGALWFNEDLVNQIGRIATSGEFTEFALPDEFKPTREEDSPINAMVTGPDGALWVTSSSANAIVKLTVDGKIAAKYVLPKAQSGPVGIVVGPDSAFWFVESGANQIGRIALDGKLSEYALPDNNSRALRITVGPDQAMWFTMISANKIGRISTDGKITTFDAAGMGPVGITTGADGALWFTGYGSTEIGRMTTDGVLTKIQVPTSNSVPYHIITGPDGNLWFTEQQGNKIGQIQLSAPTSAQPLTTFSPTAFDLPITFRYSPDWKIDSEVSSQVSFTYKDYDGYFSLINPKTAKVAGPAAPYSVISFPDDFVNWIQSHGLFQIVKTQSVLVGGLPGTQIDADATPACGAKTMWFLVGAGGWNCSFVDGHYRFIYLDNVNGERLLIMTQGNMSAQDFTLMTDASQKILDTVVFSKP
jgi:virginiamycin B lyase